MSQFIHRAVLFALLFYPSVILAQNPLHFGSDIKTADPSGHVWADGKMYLYTSHDQECQQDFWMKNWHAFSSADLVNWVDHGPILSVDDLSWADNYAWAPDAAYKNGKYYLVFPAGKGHKDRQNPAKSTKWMGIGVATSDSPTGPFKDAIGAPLWTEPYANDPSLFIDDDGKAYLYFHGKNSDYMVAEMADDLLSVKGELYKMDMGGYEPKMEGPWVFKRNDIYYFTMPENNRVLTYYTATSPKGPWQYQGKIMDAENNSNNHHSIVKFNEQWILFYHRWLNTPSECDKRQRHSAAEYLFFNQDGTIQPVSRTAAGVGDPAVAEQRQVEAQVEQLRQAMLQADSETLKAITSPALTYGHSSGRVEDQATFIDNLQNGKSDFVTLDFTNQTVNVTNDVAIVRHVLVAKSNDNGVAGKVKIGVMLTWKKDHHRWLLLARQAYKF